MRIWDTSRVRIVAAPFMNDDAIVRLVVGCVAELVSPVAGELRGGSRH